MTGRRQPLRLIAVYRPDRVSAREAALAAARAGGCTCTPEIVLDEPVAHVHHDAWCALLRRMDRN